MKSEARFLFPLNPCLTETDELKKELSAALAVADYVQSREEHPILSRLTAPFLPIRKQTERFTGVAEQLIALRDKRTRIEPLQFFDDGFAVPGETDYPYAVLRLMLGTPTMYLFAWDNRYLFVEKDLLRGGEFEEFEAFIQAHTGADRETIRLDGNEISLFCSKISHEE